MKYVIFIFTVWFTAPCLTQALELGAPFRDHAILQQGMDVPVWGWSEAGSKVTVSFGDQEKTTTSGKDGRWTIILNPLKASSEPAELRVTTPSETLRLKDVLVGEVWLASGQSNMQWLANKCNVGRVLQKGIAARVLAGTETPPIIREAKVTNVFSALHPIDRVMSEWSLDQENFSGIAFAFAYELYRELQVPIGILNCSFSSTSIESWTPREGFIGGTETYTKELYQKILESDPESAEHKTVWSAYYQQINDTMHANASAIARGEPAKPVNLTPPGNLRHNRDASWLYNARMHPMVPAAIRGAIWNQGYANIGGGITYYQNLHSLVRGWRLTWNRPTLPVYFHQFYSPGIKEGNPNLPVVGGATEMRIGTWLARDIPHTGMASQIDITGGVHYGHKTVPGQRLALHALKHQYGKDIVADGPSFNRYEVHGDKLVVTFDDADNGLLVAETRSHAIGREAGATGLANPTVIPNGASDVTLFYIADANKVWHLAEVKIHQNTVILTAPGVSEPRGVAYATGGVGFQPNLYNRAMLPMSPFIYYDHKMVTEAEWPDRSLKVAGVTPDPSTVGLRKDWYKMPLLAPQFRDNAVLQAGKPITIWGSVLHDHMTEAEGEAIVEFRFNGIQKNIPVREDHENIIVLGPDATRSLNGGKEWRVTIPPMEASTDPKTLEVRFLIDGEIAHERIATNIVVGDVWYVAAPSQDLDLPPLEAANPMVRVIKRKAKRSTSYTPSRYSVCVSRTPKNRFASEWLQASSGLAAALGQRIHAKTGNPVGIIYMQNIVPKGGTNPPIKSWMPYQALARVPALAEDYRVISSRYPGSEGYNANIKRYVQEWKTYWSDYIPEMIATRRVPDEQAWGVIPNPAALDNQSDAALTYNSLVHAFTPTTLTGIVFISSDSMADGSADFEKQLMILTDSWKKRFTGDPHFIHAAPGATTGTAIIQQVVQRAYEP